MEVDKNEVETKVADVEPVVDETVKDKDSKEEIKPVEETKTVEEAKSTEDDKSKSSEDVESKSTENAESKSTDDAKIEDSNENDNVTPELLEKIKKQVEFYFGDINMQRDKFLIEQTRLDDGWVPMRVMLNFKMLQSISKNIDAIIKSIETSDLMEISDDKKKIRRKPSRPLPTYDEEYKKAQTARTIYIKGFPKNDIYIHNLKEFFKDFEPFENIVMRKYLDHKDKDKKLKFKGSVFVQFETLDGAKAFMARESVKYNGEELIRKYSEDYSVEKAKEKEELKNLKGDTKGKKISKKENGDADTEEIVKAHNFPKGSVLQFTDVSDSTDWEDIKESLSDLGAEIAYVDYKLGDKNGKIRLLGENAAKPILEKMKDNELAINDSQVKFKILEGDEEEEYLKSVQNTMEYKKQKSFKGKRGRPKKGRSGAVQKGRKRNASPHREANASKKVAV